MRYFGGGIGHLKNTPSQQVPGFDPISEEIAVEDDDDDDDDNPSSCSGTNEDLGTIVHQPSRNVVMNSGELEVSQDDEDNEEDTSSDDDDSEVGDQTDEDEDEDEEGEDDYSYA